MKFTGVCCLAPASTSRRHHCYELPREGHNVIQRSRIVQFSKPILLNSAHPARSPIDGPSSNLCSRPPNADGKGLLWPFLALTMSSVTASAVTYCASNGLLRPTRRCLVGPFRQKTKPVGHRSSTGSPRTILPTLSQLFGHLAQPTVLAECPSTRLSSQHGEQNAGALTTLPSHRKTSFSVLGSDRVLFHGGRWSPNIPCRGRQLNPTSTIDFRRDPRPSQNTILSAWRTSPTFANPPRLRKDSATR
jgi:hypothetical protein